MRRIALWRERERAEIELTVDGRVRLTWWFVGRALGIGIDECDLDPVPSR